MRRKLAIWIFLTVGLFHLLRIGMIGVAAVVVKREVEQVLQIGMRQILDNLERAAGR